MSCGSPKRHAKLGVRMEVARMVLQAAPQDFDTMFPKVLTVVTAGIDLDAEDAPSGSGGISSPPERNALLNAPVESTGVFGKSMAKRLMSLGIDTIGALVQLSGRDLAERGLLGRLREGGQNPLTDDLACIGLALGMDADSIRNWILEGPR